MFETGFDEQAFAQRVLKRSAIPVRTVNMSLHAIVSADFVLGTLSQSSMLPDFRFFPRIVVRHCRAFKTIGIGSAKSKQALPQTHCHRRSDFNAVLVCFATRVKLLRSDFCGVVHFHAERHHVPQNRRRQSCIEQIFLLVPTAGFVINRIVRHIVLQLVHQHVIEGIVFKDVSERESARCQELANIRGT